MSTHMPGFQSIFSFLHDFELAKLATSSKRVKDSVLCDKKLFVFEVTYNGQRVIHKESDVKFYFQIYMF